MNTRREYKRLSSVGKSPMINYFTDALKGMPVLRNTGENLVPWLKSKFMYQICLLNNFAIIEETLINWFDVRIRLFQALFIQAGAFSLLIYYYDNLSTSGFGLFTLCIF
jgi:hypothetical protein